MYNKWYIILPVGHWCMDQVQEFFIPLFGGRKNPATYIPSSVIGHFKRQHQNNKKT
jgi:hypothetical protein